MTDLLTSLTAFDAFHVLVVGDFMLDEHVYGEASRLSPDAPVPVLQVERTEYGGGGASNVSSCLAGLGGLVHCCGVVGGDSAGAQLIGSLKAGGCAVDGIVTDADRPTTVKRNLVGLAQHRHPQKMFRLDIESSAPIAESTMSGLRERIDALLPTMDVICLEDYGKGVCTPEVCTHVIEAARSAGIPVLVDPAMIDEYQRYAGATVMTPNRTEAARACAAMSGDQSPTDPAHMARMLLERLDLEAVMITLDKDGMLLLEHGHEPVAVPTVARSVYDVSGAGDMVLAAVAAARAHDLSWTDAARLANAAAGLEVEVFGAQPISLAKVVQEVVRTVVRPEGKTRCLRDLVLELEAHRAVGSRIVLTNGCFDVIHAGHVTYLRDARQQGDILVVGVNADAQVKAMKGDDRPVYALDDRLSILSELACVDYVVAFEEPTAHDLISAIRPDLYVKGGDYRAEEINEYDLVNRLGIECRILAHRPGLGSSDIVDHVRGNSPSANLPPR